MSTIEVIGIVVAAITVAGVACWVAVEIAVRGARRRRHRHDSASPGGI